MISRPKPQASILWKIQELEFTACKTSLFEHFCVHKYCKFMFYHTFMPVNSTAWNKVHGKIPVKQSDSSTCVITLLEDKNLNITHQPPEF